MFSRRNVFSILAAFVGLLALGITEASAQSIRFFVANSAGVYEIRDGSGTGGRFVNTGAYNAGGLSVRGYTDRATRGDVVLVRFEGGTVAEYVGFRSDNGVLNNRASWISMPVWAFGRVWVNPNADNVRGLAKLPGRPEVSRRLPIGTRP